MKLTNKNDKILLFLHWTRIAQLGELSQFTGLTLDHLQRQVPAMAEQGFVNRLVWKRDRFTDPYAAYENGVESRRILEKTFGIPYGRTRTPAPLTSATKIEEKLYTSKIVTPLWTALGESFIPQYVTPVKVDVVHLGERTTLKLLSDFNFILPIGSRQPLHRIEADNAGTEDGVTYKSEPMIREDIEKQSLFRKVLGYLAAFQKGERFRVLIVCRSHARATSIHDDLFPLVAEKGGFEYRNYVLVNYLKSLQADPLHSWSNLAGEQASLLPQGTNHG